MTILIGLGALAFLIVIWMYNSLIVARNRIQNAWAQIEVQLKRRHDLIPNLVEVAKGYMKHERELLENVTKARQQAISASGVQEKAAAENMLTSTLRSLFAVAEAYPELKANQNLLALQEELTSTENKISFARQHYNDMVMDYNAKLQKIPTNVIADLFKFKAAPFFELQEPSEREPVKVKF